MQFCSNFCIIFMRLPATTPSIFLFSVLKTINKNDETQNNKDNEGTKAKHNQDTTQQN